MKAKLLFLMMITICVNTFAQIGWQEYAIINDANYAKGVYAADIDGDGDKDVLYANSVNVSTVSWCENTDGAGTFGPQQIITTDVDGARSVYAIDIDGDDDLDVLSASKYDNKIAWYENTDGQGSFGLQQIITTNAMWAWAVYATDIDGDGDIDVLSASNDDDKIAWHENTNGLGTVWIEHIITTNADGTGSVYAADIDGDDDMDVLSASWEDHKIAWYENIDGQGSFGSQQIITTDIVNGTSVYATDLDGDDDMDVLSASNGDNKIAWYENTNGQGTFSGQEIITTEAYGAESVYADDIDNDGDMDVLSASVADNKIAWYENTNGQGNFGSQQIITTSAMGAWAVFAADLNGDNDIDVLSASPNDDKIAWYENLGDLNVNENTLLNFLVYPTPTTDILTIQAKTRVIQIEIYNQLGQLVLSIPKTMGTNNNTIDISVLGQGIYFCKIKDENGNTGTRKIVKE